MSAGLLKTENERVAMDAHHSGALGKHLAGKVQLIKAKYSFASDGGAVGSINLKDEFGQEIDIPSGAIVKQVIIDRVTAPASAGGAGTVALTLNAAGDLLAAVDADTLSALHAGIPVGTAATAVKATAKRKLVLSIAVEALTAGVLDIYCEVYFQD